MGRRASVVAVLAVAASTACGSTVPADQLSPAGGRPAAGGGLGPAAPAAVGQQGLGPAPGSAAAPLPAAGGAAAPGPAGQPQPAGAPAARRTEAGRVPVQPVDRSPLRVGLLYVNNDAAAGAGVDNGNTFGPRRVLEALVAARNRSGGFAGRTIVPTYVEIRSSSTSYGGDLQAACARFADDAKVSVVVSLIGLAEEQLSSCLARSGIAHVNGSYGLGDRTTIAGQPLTVSPIALGADRRLVALLEQMRAIGHLTPANRLGVLVEGCPFNVRATERSLLPAARRLGLTVVSTRSTRCFAGVNDLSGLASDAQGAVLEFTSRNVDRVLFVSAVEGNLMLVFATAAESQRYRPGYALSSLAIPNVIKDNVPTEQLAGAKGLGWLPTLDDAGAVVPSPAARSCVDSVRSQGVTPVSRTDYFFTYAPCDAFALVDRVLRLSRGATAPAAWTSALGAVGTGLASATVLDGRTDFRDGRREGPARVRPFTWVTACSCFRYTGAGVPV